jgi:SAM-dependent methyltransferase
MESTMSRSALRRAISRTVERTPWLHAALKWDTWAYLKNRALGRPYAAYYAARMARFASKDPDGGCGDLTDRRWQFEFCRAKNIVRPDTRFLDYGCGSGAAGTHFVEYLAAGHYVGADITAEFLAIARGRIERMGLAHKAPRYIHLPNGDMSPLDDVVADVAWSQSVLNHMPAEDQARVIRRILGLLRPGGAYYGTVLIGEPRHTHHLNFWLPASAYRKMAEDAGGTFELVEGWHHPHATIGELARFSRARSG